MTSETSMRVLVIDDEKVIRDGCERALRDRGCLVHKAEDGNDGIACMEKGDFDVVLLDLMMPGIDGFSVLKWIKENRPATLVIVITGFATVEKAVAAMKEGAFDFVGKPFSPEYIRLVVQRAAEKRSLLAEAERLRQERTLDLRIIAEEQSRLKTVFGCMEGAILVTDHEQVVVLHNPAAIKMLEIQTDPVIGKPLSASIRDQGAVSMVAEVVSVGAIIAREFPPGTISRLHLRARCAPVRSNGGKILGSVTVFEDITTEKHIDQLKSEFIDMVTHELRAPLASVEQMIYAFHACEQDDQERRSHLLKRISVRIKDQLQLIENLLSLSKLDNQAEVFNFEPALGNEILKMVVDLVGPRAESNSVELEYEPCKDQWWINAEPNQIRAALTNIVDNAVKYTPANGRVTVSAVTDRGLVMIKVVDTGIGIKAEDLPHIFDRFFRVKEKATRQVTGSGLGLSLVKKVVEAHNGFIDVASEPERGTTFTVSFPLVEQPGGRVQ